MARQAEILDSLTGFDFNSEEWADVIFSEQNLQDKQLINSNFSGKDFTDADLSNADLSDGSNFTNANFTGADLTVANLSYGSDFTKADFTQADLTDANLSYGSDFTKADFTSAVLTDANLSYGSDFTDANFTDAVLKDADLGAYSYGSYNSNFTNANFTGADLTNADLSYGANFTNANFTGANLTYTDLSDGSNFTNADFTNADLSELIVREESYGSVTRTISYGSDLSFDSNFTNAKFTGADLTNADLSYGSDFTNTDFVSATLKGADLKGADFTKADFTKADLTNADLSYGSDFTDANFTDAVLKDADLSDSNFYISYGAYGSYGSYGSYGANFTNANFTRADLTNADLSYGSTFTNANFTEADLTNADLSYGNFANANFTEADLTNADLSYGYFANANFTDAILSTAYISYANFANADFTGADLSNLMDAAYANFTGANFYNATYSEDINFGDIVFNPPSPISEEPSSPISEEPSSPISEDQRFSSTISNELFIGDGEGVGINGADATDLINVGYSIYLGDSVSKLTQINVLGETIEGGDTADEGRGLKDTSLNGVNLLGGTDYDDVYRLDITAAALGGYALETTDIKISYDADIFNDISDSDIQIGSKFSVANAVQIDNEEGVIRLAAASLGDLVDGSEPITSETVLASIFFNFDEAEIAKINTANVLEKEGFREIADGLTELKAAFDDPAVTSIEELKAAIIADNTYNNNLSLEEINQAIDAYQSSSSSDSELAERLNNGINRLQWLINTPETETVGSGSAFGDNQTISNVSDELNLELNYLLGLTGSDSSGALFDENSEPLTIEVNTQETVLSKALDDESTYKNREIKTLAELGGDISVSGQDVVAYQELQRLEEQGDGLIVGSTRTIGSAEKTFTNLIRSGDTVSASTIWQNTGNSETNNIEVNGITNANATFVSGSLTNYDLVGGTFSSIDGSYTSGDETTTLEVNIEVNKESAGKILDLSDGIYSLKADESNVFINDKGSKNLITYQGDLNYDGRVSMKDLAYLNAGAARQELDDNNDVIADSVAKDVDANFSGKIDIADLAILDQDWGKTLHTGDKEFTGSDEITWTELGTQGKDGSWDNSAFTDQNEVELALGNFNQTLNPAIAGVSGADDVGQNQTNDLLGTDFQDALAFN